MKGHSFAINFLQAIEYFKPKLSRVDSQNTHKVEVKNFIIELSNEADSKTE
jgi:hydrogenase maturation factor HypF (carbamoyltransferase family)